MRVLSAGESVRLTGRFLRQTGQVAGGEGPSVWIVMACACKLCTSHRFVAVNEKSYDDPARWRHIAAGNLCRTRALDIRNVDNDPRFPLPASLQEQINAGLLPE